MRQHKWKTGRVLGIVMAAAMLGGIITTPICAVAEESEVVEMQDGEMQDSEALDSETQDPATQDLEEQDVEIPDDGIFL